MAQLSTAGGLISTLAAPEPMRFSSTGAGVPQTSCRTGWEISTSAAIGASSFTHSRKPAMISASDQHLGLGRLGRELPGLASGAADALFWLGFVHRLVFLCLSSGSGAWTGSVAGLMAEVLCAGGSGGFASGAGSGLGLDRRAASWKAGSARRVLGERNRLGRTDLDRDGGRLRCRRAQPRDRVVVAGGAAQRGRGPQRPTAWSTRRPRIGQERQHPRSLRHALLKNSQRPRVPSNMGGSCGRTMMGWAGEP